MHLVAAIPANVPMCTMACAPCGSYGTPPIYSAGNYVIVRQTAEAHQRIAKFLTDIGALVPPTRNGRTAGMNARAHRAATPTGAERPT